MRKVPVIFQIESSSINQLHSTMPLEVRKSNLALVARSLTNQVVQLEPGNYFVAIKLPDGTELETHVEVVLDIEMTHTVQLPFDKHSSEVSRDLSTLQWSTKMLGSVFDDRIRPNISADNLDILDSKGVKLRIFTNDRFVNLEKAFNQTETSLRLVSESPKVWRVAVEVDSQLRNRTYLMQLLQLDAQPLNIVLAAAETSTALCYPMLIAQNGRVDLSARLVNNEANLLLAYQAKGLLQEATTIAMSPTVAAELLLKDKRSDPLAAAAGAYALLRLGELDRLHDWTENLKNWFYWLADGVITRAEQLARLGEHDKALVTLLELKDRPLPVFSEGLALAVDRLHLYLSSPKGYFSQEDYLKANHLLQKLSNYSRCTDFSRPFTTFTGLNPDLPNADLLDREALIREESVLRI